MFIIDTNPDDDTNIDTQGAADAAAKGAPETQDHKPLTPEQLDAQAMAAFDKGLAVADGTEPPKEDADGVSDAVVLAGDDTVLDPAQPRAKPGEKPAPAADEEEEAPAVDEATEKEIVQRGLKGDSAERFRSLANDSRELKSLKETIVPQLEERAAAADTWEQTVQSTGATPQQFGFALGALAAINSGDPKRMNQALDAMVDEARTLAKRLGRKIEATDPLEADPELLKRVKSGDLERADAERELATRVEATLLRENQERTTKQTSAMQERNAGIEAVRNAGNEIAAAEEAAHPGEGAARYRAKLPLIVPGVQLIQESYPPAEWPARIKKLYADTPDPVLAKPKPKTGPSPVRPGLAAAHNMTTKPKDDMEAFDRGLELAGTPRA